VPQIRCERRPTIWIEGGREEGREGGRKEREWRKEGGTQWIDSLCFESLLDPFVLIFPPPLHISLPISPYLLLPLTP
jgi:hypothetical protein